MSSLAQMVQDSGRGALPDNVTGLPPLDLTDMQGIAIPISFEIENVLGDILMCEIADESPTGEVNRNGIWVSQNIGSKMWRVALVIKVGPTCSGNIKIGDHIMYPSDKGLPMVRTNKKYIFLNEPRVFCTCKPT